jgi:hypothetical protein
MILDLSELILELGLQSSSTEQERAICSAALVRAESAVKRYLGYDPTHGSRIEYYPRAPVSVDGGASIYEVTDSLAYLRSTASGVSDALQVQHFPIRSITNLWIDYDGRSGSRVGSFPDSTRKTQGEDYWANFTEVDADGESVCVDGIIYSVGLWPTTAGSVKIEYVAGYKKTELRAQLQDSNGLVRLDASPIYEAVMDEAVRRVHKVFSRMKKSRIGFVSALTSESLGDYSYSIDPLIMQSMVGTKADLMAESMQKLDAFRSFANLGL